MSNTNVADLPGSRLLRLKAADKSQAQYSPGHVSVDARDKRARTHTHTLTHTRSQTHSQTHHHQVLALRIPNATPHEIDGKHGDGTTAPYTITTCNPATGVFAILFRVVEVSLPDLHHKPQTTNPLILNLKPTNTLIQNPKP